MHSLTALILTHNEKENIRRTISALPAVDEVVLIDSESSDETVPIAVSLNPGVRVISRAFNSHTQQWNFGLDQVRTEWVLTLDADYELSNELRAEISALNPPNDVNGIRQSCLSNIRTRPARIELSFAGRSLSRQAGRYVDDGHTQTLHFYSASQELRPPSETEGIQTLSGKIVHDDRKPLSHWVQSQDRYAILEARHLLEIGNRKSENGRTRVKERRAFKACFLEHPGPTEKEDLFRCAGDVSLSVFSARIDSRRLAWLVLCRATDFCRTTAVDKAVDRTASPRGADVAEVRGPGQTSDRS